MLNKTGKRKKDAVIDRVVRGGIFGESVGAVTRMMWRWRGRKPGAGTGSPEVLRASWGRDRRRLGQDAPEMVEGQPWT